LVTAKRLPTAQRRDQLADAALRILSTQGARAVTVKNIAERVGITDGAVFRHFPDTAALFDAAVARFDAQLPELPSAELAPVDRLGAFFVGRTRAVQANPDVLGLTMSDRLQELVGGASARRVKKRIEESVAFVGRCLAEAQARGELAHELEPRVLTWMITGAMRGAARSGMDPDDAWSDVRRSLFKTPRRKRKKR
jgi:AcrR family transcriptional regulator